MDVIPWTSQGGYMVVPYVMDVIPWTSKGGYMVVSYVIERNSMILKERIHGGALVEVLVLEASSMLQGAERTNLVSVVGWNPLATVLQSSRGHHECITRHSSVIILVRTIRFIK
ncbi:hypothetical protein LR48_Vigan03g294400 [Vigna angularis]|uniref:Uncharacterized protein n=1 Tax=Phaseolus angularis TaxID=3914 RepID=A0A0L9UAJ0_PHAAN|nr:hypothetical protein LR48_Vigan03g294400 [Vigna angularis]